MIVITEIQDKIFDWVNAYSGINIDPVENAKHITWARQKMPQTRLPSIILSFITGFNSIGQDNYIYKEDDEKYSIEGHRQFTISIQVHGSNSFDIITKLNKSLKLPEVLAFFKEKNMGIGNVATVDPIPAVLETEFEERYVMDILFYTTDEQVSSASLIEHVKSSYDISGKTGDVNIN